MPTAPTEDRSQPAADSVSVVIPAFNEAAIIERTVADYCERIVERVGRGEMIVVDDGSTDGTRQIVDDIAKRCPGLRVVHHASRRGHGPSLWTGWRDARGDWVLTTDADYQQRPAEFEKLRAEAANGKRLVCGVRGPRRDAVLRRALSAALRVALRILFDVRLRDANCPFKLVERRLLGRIQPLIPETSVAPSIMLAVAAAVLEPESFAAVEVEHLPRRAGRGHLRGMQLAWFCLAGVVQLLRFRKALRGAQAQWVEAPGESR